MACVRVNASMKERVPIECVGLIAGADLNQLRNFTANGSPNHM